MDQKFLRWRDVTARYGFARSTLFKLVAEGRFPKPHKLNSKKLSAWSVAELEVWERPFLFHSEATTSPIDGV